MQASFNKQLYPSKQSMMAQNKFKKVQAYSNHFNITMNKSQKFTEWHLKIIDADKAEKYDSDQKIEDAIPLDSRQQREFFVNFYRRKLIGSLGYYAETGNTIYSPTDKNHKDIIVLEGHTEYALVLTKKNNDLTFESLMPSKNIRAPLQRMVNTFLKKILKKAGFTEWGRNKKYYNKKISTFLEKHNICVYQGCVYVNEYLEGGLKLIVSPSNRIIRQRDLYEEFYDSTAYNQSFERQTEYFKGVSALCKYNHRIIRLDGIDKVLTSQSKFPDTQYKNYFEYFKKKYKIELYYRDQPLVYRIVKKKIQKPNGEIGVEEKIEHYPPELLLPTGLTDEMRSNFRVMKDLGNITIARPEQKFKKIQIGLDQINDNKKEVGLNFVIDRDSNKVQGYYMQKPRILGPKFKQQNLKGERINVGEMCKTVNLSNWIFLYDFKHGKDYVQAITNIKKAASRFKIRVSDPHVQKLNKNFGPNDLNKILSKVPNAQMVFFMVPPQISKYLYKKMKTYLNNKGLASQFLTSYFFKKDAKNLSKFGNLILQMSTKLGSCPWAIDLSFSNKKNTIIMGADVFHERISQSVASLVTQYGEKFLNNYTTSKIQAKGVEISNNLSTMVIDHVRFLKKKNVPIDQILFYRDGVAENQEQQVINVEIKKIIEKLKQEFTNPPKLTFVIVTKRIDDRFGVQGQNQQLENPQGGFVVQDQVVKEGCANFFMVAQRVNQGTATPTHYKIILNQCQFKLPEIEKITYDLAHFYYNWAGPVKVPSCVQYAHKCAYQIGILQNDYVDSKLQQEFHFL